MASDVGSGNFDIGMSTSLVDVPKEPEIMHKPRSTEEPRLKTGVELARTPAVAAVISEALKIFTTDKSDFELAEEFIDTDPTVGGNADALAMLVQKAYRGPRIPPRISDKNEKTGKVDSKLARKIAIGLEVADDVLYDMDFKGTLFSCTVNGFQDGDVILRHLGGTEFEMLPRKFVTALPEKYVSMVNGKLKSTWTAQFGPKSGNFDAIFETPTMSSMGGGAEILMKADYYVINENTESEFVIPKEDIIHIKMNPYGRTTVDQLGRTCFNMWSVPPMKRLKKTLLWKANAMVNDILWRDAMPPREHHRLDLSEITPDQYEGDSPEDRLLAAIAAARRVIESYIQFISHKAVDVGYVTDLVTEINVLESAARTYADPNDLLKQLDEDVHATSGVPRGAMYGESRGAYASELLISNYAGLRAEFIGDRVARPFEDWLHTYIGDTFPDTVGKKVARRIRLKFRLILPRDIREIAQAVSLLMDAMVVDVSQILETVGLDTMTDEQFKQHMKTVTQITKARGSDKPQQVDKKSFKKDAKSEGRKQETPDTRKGKEMSMDHKIP